MRNGVKYLLGLSVLSTMLLGACSQKTSGFLPQVTGADHVVVSDWVIGSRLFLTGQDAEGLVQAVSSAEGPPVGLHLATSCSAEFYRKTNLLARIYFEGGNFATNTPEFVYDKSGTLAALQKRMECDKLAQTNWIRILVQLAGDANLANLQTWRDEILQADQTKQVLAGAPGGGEGSTELWVPFAKPPQFFETAGRARGIGEPGVCVLPNRSRKAEVVLIDWGHQYGFLVGPVAGYVAAFRAEQITNFAPGICAFHRGNYYYK
jgi:hypothetical protein